MKDKLEVVSLCEWSELLRGEVCLLELVNVRTLTGKKTVPGTCPCREGRGEK